MPGDSETAKVVPIRAARKCPECGHPSVREQWPFCSARCRDTDLNRWLSGAYVIPGRPMTDEDAES